MVLPVPDKPAFRQAFVRGEEGAILEGDLENHSNAALEQVTVTACQFTSSGRLVNRLTTSLGAIPAGEKRSVSLPVETRLGEKNTDLRVEISYRGGKIERQLSVLLGPAPARRMPALMWGFSAPVSVLADLGFTHGLDYGLGFPRILPEGNDPTLVLRKLDSSLAVGVSLAKSAGVVLPDGAEPEQFYRRTRTGLAGFKANSKPQFEVGKGGAPGGLVKSEELRVKSVEKIVSFGKEKLGLELLGLEESPIRGKEMGNIEYLSYWRKP